MSGEPKYVYVLLMDDSGTTRSINEPFGLAVITEEEAKRFVSDKTRPVGYSQSYCKVAIFDNKDAALEWKYPGFYEQFDKKVK